MERTINLGLGWEFRVKPAEEQQQHGWADAHEVYIIDTATDRDSFGPFYVSGEHADIGFSERNGSALSNAQGWLIQEMATRAGYEEEDEDRNGHTAYKRGFAEAMARVGAPS